MIDNSIMVTTRQAADILDVHESSIKRWCTLDQLTCTQTPGGHRRIPFNALMSFAKQKDIACSLHIFDQFADRVWDGMMRAEKSDDFTLLANLGNQWIEKTQPHYIFELLHHMTSNGYPVAQLMDRIIAPIMDIVGQEYLNGTLSIGDEHRITYIMRDLLVRLSGQLHQPFEKNSARRAILGCVRSQEHELGCLMAKLVLESQGWEVIYLGLNVPTEEFARMQIHRNASLVCIALMPPTTPSEVQHIIELLEYMYDRRKPYNLVMGGPVRMEVPEDKKKKTPIDSIQHFTRMTDFSNWLSQSSGLQKASPTQATSKDLLNNSLNRSFR